MSRGPRLPHYSIIGRLGKGSFADVYLGQNTLSGAQHAIKIFRSAGPDPENVNASYAHHIHYRTELQVLSRVTHPNLVRLYDAGRTLESRAPFIVLDFIQGGDFVSASKNVSKSHFFELLAQVCRVLNHLHRKKICHGDLKPQNALVVRNPVSRSSAPSIKLIDLGSATVSTRASGHTMQGSPFYMSPEILQGQRHSVASDV